MGKEGMGLLREGHHLNKGGPKVKKLLRLLCAQQMFHLKFLLIAKKKSL
jgi:hypothetical protein